MLTSQQVISLATQIAKVPGMTVQAGQFMNARLVQIALEQDLDIIRRTLTIPVVTGNATYNLPANYLRAREVFYNINGVVFTLNMKALEDYDKLYKGPSLQAYPYLYSTDLGQSPPQLNLYPIPSVSFTLTVRYMDNLVEIVTPETSAAVPWFQDQLLLIKMVAEDLMMISDDTRNKEFYQMNDDKMTRLLKMSNDKEGRAQKVKRDPDSFRSARSSRPTKVQGGN